MPQPLVSVIVPAYNAAGFISRCVESITSQSYPELEILLLNDGSTDDTLAVCRKLAAADSRIRVVDKPNTGAADTRSCGLALAHGEYIQFADSDDHLLPGCTANLVAAMQRSHADLVRAPYRMMVPRKDGGYDTREYSLLPAGVYNKVDYLWQLTGNAAAFYYGVLWNKLYRRDLIIEHDIRCCTELKWCEDFLFNMDYYARMSTACTLDTPIYYYIKRKGSLANSYEAMAPTRVFKMRKAMYEPYKELFESMEMYEKHRTQIMMFFIDFARDGGVPPFAPQEAEKACMQAHRREELLKKRLNRVNAMEHKSRIYKPGEHTNWMPAQQRTQSQVEE